MNHRPPPTMPDDVHLAACLDIALSGTERLMRLVESRLREPYHSPRRVLKLAVSARVRAQQAADLWHLIAAART